MGTSLSSCLDTMSSTLLTLLVVTLTLAYATSAATPAATLNADTIKVYTASQLGLNATAAASVFASDAKLTIPLGSPQLLGLEAIMGFYSQFMSALDELVEIPGQKVFNGDTFVSYEKEGQLFFKNGQSQTFFARRRSCLWPRVCSHRRRHHHLLIHPSCHKPR